MLFRSLFDLANRALEERDVRRSAENALRDLNARTGYTVHLASYEAGEVIYIDKYDSTHPMRMYSRIGRRAPLHCTAVAKVLLSDLVDSGHIATHAAVSHTARPDVKLLKDVLDGLRARL